jgi:cell division protein FtsQ
MRLRAPRFVRRWFGRMDGLWLPRGAGVAAATAFFLASGAYGAVRGDHLPELFGQLRDLRDAAANTVGFRISEISIAGEKRLGRDEILDAAGITGRSSLLFLDASDVRTQLKSNPWIADATVLKLYPGRLRIGIIERDAFALWQREGKVEVIAQDGTVVEPYSGTRFNKLPLVVGEGAETHAKEFLTLLDQYPLVRDKLRAAVFVAERRWNLMLDSGIEVRLPEEEAAAALDQLIKLDSDDKLLTRDIAAIDLRLPDRVTVQLSDEAAAARAEALKAKAPKKKAGAA